MGYKEQAIKKISTYGKDPIGECSICHREVKYWLATGNDVDTEYRIIGNGKRFTTCPYCYSQDRDRWQEYVAQMYTSLFDLGNHKNTCATKRILHFAPERYMESFFRSHMTPKVDYLTGDIAPGRADCVVDITKMQFDDGSFDFVIANHVLEHIKDEERAMSELKRVLKDSGKLLLSVPISLETNTLESPEYSKTAEMRIRWYGQDDHVRLYGQDYITHFSSFGFRVESFSPKDVMSKEEAEWRGLSYDDIMMIMRKA